MGKVAEGRRQSLVRLAKWRADAIARVARHTRTERGERAECSCWDRWHHAAVVTRIGGERSCI